MKQKILNLTLLLFCMIVGMGSAWGEDVTWIASAQGYENGQSVNSVTVSSSIKISFDNSQNSNSTKYYTTGEAIRVYGGNSFTVTSSGEKITKIVFTFGTGDGKNEITANPGSLTNGTWTSTGTNSVKFTISGSTGHRRINSITVTYGSDTPAPATHTITFGSHEYGSFTATVDGNTITSGASVEEGKTVVLTANADQGYEFSYWNAYKTGDQYNYVNFEGENSFKMPKYDVTVNAYFTESTPVVVVTPPTFSIEGGTYSSPQNVTIYAPGASYIYYTTCDDDIAEMNGVCIEGESGSVTISNSCTLKAIAFDEALNASEITTATYTIPVARTITWSVNGETSTQTVNDGDKITFEKPSITSIYGKTFVGWVEEKIDGTTDATPSFVTSATASKDIAYYAVFAKENTGGTPKLEKIYSVDAVVPGTYALIRNGEYSFVNNEKQTNTPSQVKIVKNESTIVLEDKMTWTVTGNNLDGFEFTSTSDNSLYLWGSSTNDGIRIAETSAKQNATKIWYVKNDDTYGVVIYNNSDSSGKRYLCGFGDQDWRNYKDMKSSQLPANLYKVVGGVSYSNYCTAVPKSIKITLNSACHDEDGMIYGTFSSSKPFYVSDDIIVSEVGVLDGELLVYEYKKRDLVPANTGVMVSATDGGDYYVEIEEDEEMIALAESVLDANCLRPSGDDGISADAMATADANCTYYRLTMHNGEEIGYWWGAADGAAFDLAANKAYLAVPSGTSVKANLWFGGVETSISAPAALNAENGVIYNLNGQRVSSATKGIYIKNGKKYFVK